ncbi:MAG TPA: PKD domain-containing protein [Candidatus Eisenbacteria bacterium]|jgi:PKD repeat protein|nr:PKD domain-containing protein [Candidatus Eisenbacteria bacterium]
MKNKLGFKSGLLVALAAGLFGFQASAFAGGYTDKSIHDSGDVNTYKHPNQKSFTGPFDYSPTNRVERVSKEPVGRCNCFTFDATKSHDVDGQKLSVLWDLGDGTTSDKPVVTHCYEKAGDYKVALTVKDSSGMVCDSGYATASVSANFPPTAAAGEDKRVCLGESVSFDGSSSTASSTPKYTWDFGDGETGEGSVVSHSYQKPGSYRVRLTVDDGKSTECSVATDALVATVADRASVTLKGTEATCVGRNAHFDAQGTGGKYTWDFGDGETAEGGSSMGHTYKKGGTYTVRVTADNGHGDSCSIAVDSMTVRVNTNPIADAGENLACCVGQSTTFDGSKSSHPDGSPLKYHWDFGDGQGADEARTSHTYEKSGSYRVVLTVSDDSGSECSTSSDSFVAEVNTKPEAVIQVR